MNIRHVVSSLVLSLFAFVSPAALAQIAAGGTSILIPVVASTGSFTSEIVVKDESGSTRSIGVKFYESLDSSTPGAKTCSPVSLGAFQVTTFSLAAQCALAGGSHFGFVILTDTSGANKWFFGFSRTSNPQGIGFSVEGYPIGHVGGGDPFSEVAGVKRKAATATSPAFQTNCFAATLDDPVSYSISVDDASGSGSVTGTLPAFSMHRYLDIYAAAGLPAGDHDNTTVTFEKTDGAQFANTLIGFCTVQDITSFGADFRIAKTLSAADPGQARLNCVGLSFGASDCTTTLQPSAPSVPNASSKVRLVTEIRAPDTVRCSLVSSGVANLEMRLVRDSDGVVLAGGDNATSFTYSTGKRSAIGFGFHQYYWIEVGMRASSASAIPFGVQCTSGNGIADPLPVDTTTDNF
jgi:hypothetical protein